MTAFTERLVEIADWHICSRREDSFLKREEATAGFEGDEVAALERVWSVALRQHMCSRMQHYITQGNIGLILYWSDTWRPQDFAGRADDVDPAAVALVVEARQRVRQSSLVEIRDPLLNRDAT